MGTTRKLATEPPMAVPSPNDDSESREFFRERRDVVSVATFNCMASTAGGARAARARWAVGADILYGALVLVRI